MKLDHKALAYACAAICGGSVLVVGISNLVNPDYGSEWLLLLASIFPGYTGERSFESVLIGTGYALVAGAAIGWLLGWLYNRLIK